MLACLLLFLLLIFLLFHNGLDPIWHSTLTVRTAVIFLGFVAIFLFFSPDEDESEDESEEDSFLYRLRCLKCLGFVDSSAFNCNSERVTLRT